MGKKDFKKIETYRVPLYPFHISFAIPTDEMAKKYLVGHGMCQREGYNIFIYLKDKKTALNIVTHEIFHATEFIMEHIGQKHGPVPNETWAYLISWITEKYQEFIK